MNLVILGPQGCGKGTQAQLLIDNFGFTHIETGEILRKIAESDHPWGKRIKSMMLRGVLVSDDILAAVLRESLKKSAEKGFLFDGTPRNLTQYELIGEILAVYGQKIDEVILLNIPEPETIKRLSNRRTCEKCGRVYNLLSNPSPFGDKCECGGILSQREDDVPESIKKRLEAFWKSTEKVIEKAQSENKLININGERPIKVIYQEIVTKLGL